MERLGVLGGSFDPPHLGHLAIAQAAQEQLPLDRVLWVPAGLPPHKTNHADDHHRVAMTELTISDNPRFSLSRLDVDRPGPHFTSDLLALLHAEFCGQAQFWFVVGSDSLRDLASWHEPARILGYCRLAVYPRHARINWRALKKVVPEVRTRVDRLAGKPLSISSTKIRERLRKGESIRDWVHPQVESYIRQHGLYGCRQPHASTIGDQ
jgi:nicotinate-nucleotide adenylyltransferase